MKSKLALLCSIAFSLATCARPFGELSHEEQQVVVSRNYHHCVAKGISVFDIKKMRLCMIDEMCCSAPRNQTKEAVVFDASKGERPKDNAKRKYSLKTDILSP